MKKFIKGRWFPLLIATVAGTVLLVFLYCKGFRITYAPNLENSWDAISSFAAWAGVVMSFVAIMIAIWIPEKIADRQDKIALFEKRYELYEKVLYWQKIIALLTRVNDINEAYITCHKMLNRDFIANKNLHPISNFLTWTEWSEFLSDLMHDIDELKKVDFLFAEIPRKYVHELITVLIDVFGVYTSTAPPDVFNQKKKALVDLSERFKKDGILERMQDDLKL